jgi:ATP/maltotriose-dependent transcriptional regulator MalT
MLSRAKARSMASPSLPTVKGHLQNIYGKLNVGKRREAMKIGIL